MNVALVLAGGLGLRMGKGSSLPKQFFRLADKPVLIHTLEVFEKHSSIDAVCVVYLPTWEQYLQECLEHFEIKKAKWLVPGGDIRQKSVFNGLEIIEQNCPPDTIVLVHDGVRPFITEDVLTQNIESVKSSGNAMTGVRCTDTLITSKDGNSSDISLVRDKTFSIQTPQSYRLAEGLALYRKAYAEGKETTVNCCELFIAMGQKVHLVTGPKNNMKLTTEEDIAFLRAMHEIYHQ